MQNDIEKLLRLARRVVEDTEKNVEANPSSEEIQVVIVEPMKLPYKKTIKDTLEAKQEIVGGHIENVFIGETATGARIGITLNEEGKLQDLAFNRKIVNFDILVGTFFITAYNLAGEAVTLTDAECEKYIRKFAALEVYI